MKADGEGDFVFDIFHVPQNRHNDTSSRRPIASTNARLPISDCGLRIPERKKFVDHSITPSLQHSNASSLHDSTIFLRFLGWIGLSEDDVKSRAKGALFANAVGDPFIALTLIASTRSRSRARARARKLLSPPLS